jgi:hypothetical protein
MKIFASITNAVSVLLVESNAPCNLQHTVLDGQVATVLPLASNRNVYHLQNCDCYSHAIVDPLGCMGAFTLTSSCNMATGTASGRQSQRL